MFKDGAIESTATTGTGTYTLAGAVGSAIHFGTAFPSGGKVAYFAQTATRTKWEYGYGTLTLGGSRTLTRNVVGSSNGGAAINWQGTDAPVYIFSIASGDALAGLLRGSRASTAPWWLDQGGRWFDETGGTTWTSGFIIEKLRLTGTTDIEIARVYPQQGLYSPNSRQLWLDNGASDRNMVAEDSGKVISFNTLATTRTYSLLSGASLPHGFTVWINTYNNTLNGVTLDPSGSNRIDDLGGGQNLSLPPLTLVKLSWDGNRAQWVTDLPNGFVSRHFTTNMQGAMRWGQEVTDVPGAGNTFLGGAQHPNGTQHLSNNGAYVQSVNRNSVGPLVTFGFNGSSVGQITTTGSSTAYNTTSDHRVKENFVPMTGALARIADLNPGRFNFIATPLVTVDGFLAHEVAEVIPEAVTGEKDAEWTDETVPRDEQNDPIYNIGDPILQGLDQAKLTPLLTGGVKELHALAIAQAATIDALQAALADLTSRIEALEA